MNNNNNRGRRPFDYAKHCINGHMGQQLRLFLKGHDNVNVAKPPLFPCGRKSNQIWFLWFSNLLIEVCVTSKDNGALFGS